MSEFLNQWKKYFTFAAFLSCFINFLQLTFPFYMFTIYRNVVVSYSGYSLKSITVAALFALTILGFFHFVRSRLLFSAGKRLNQKIIEKVYSGIIQNHSAAGSKTYTTGLNDINTLRDFFASNALNSIFDAPWSPFYLVLLFFIHPVLGIVSVLGAVSVIILAVLQEILIRGKMSEANRKNAENQKFVNSFLNNIDVINGMGMSGAVSDWYDKGNTEVILNQTQSSLYAGAVQAIIKPLQNVVQVFIYCFGAYYAMTEGFSVGLMVAASIIMGRSLGPVMQVTSAWKMTNQARDAFDRLMKYNNHIDNLPEKMDIPLPEGNFDFSSVGYTVGGSLILYDINFKINSGEFVGIIGPSGAGKTTLCRLILGIWPSTLGNVFLDGLDAFKWDRELSGKVTGYLPQEVELFPGTLSENIAKLGIPDNEKVKAVVDLCGITNLVESLPDGYETQIEGEEGVKFSGGQKQIIGIARALYDFPNILILDEPTSNLDESAEQILINALNHLKTTGHKMTCIIVTHKPAILETVDKILVLNQGRVAKYGAKEEVFKELAASSQQKKIPKQGGSV